MAGKGLIKGITIEFGADVTKLNKGLNEIHRSLSNVQDELRTVNRELKFNPGNATLLKQKFDLFKTSVETAKNKLDGLKQMQEKLNKKNIDKNSAAYRQLEQEIIKTKSQLREYAREMVKVGNAKLTAVGTQIQNVGKKLSTLTRRARQAAAALTGIALYKGFERLKTLDDVSTELRKLGYEGKNLDRVMEGAKGSVLGTKFALTDMSKVAKGALGAGVEESYKLGDYLQRVADLSAVSGTGVQHMGALMNKALSKGRIDARLLNQMNANGIPIYHLLAKSMGVTKQELDKLVRTGKVGFDDLYKATSKYKGMAQALGTETLSGAVTVLGQQFGIMGADFLSGAYEPIKTGVQGIVKKLKELQANGTFKEWGKAVGEAIKYFVDWFKTGEASVDGLSGKAQGLINAFSPFVKLIGTLVQAFMALPAPIKAVAAGFALFGGPLLVLAGGLMKVVSMVSGFARLVGVIGGIKAAFLALLGPVGAVIAIIAAVVAAGVLLYKNWAKIGPKIQNMVTVVTTRVKTNFNTMKTAVTNVWTSLKTKVTNIANTIKTGVSNAFNTLKSKVSGIWNGIKTAITRPIESAKNTLKGIINKIKGMFPFKLGKILKFKLPRFRLETGSKTFFGKTIKYPTGFGISWHRKAMEDPYMFTRPTLFGAGEAGDEMLYGRKALMRDIAEAVNGNGSPITVNVYGSDNMSVNELANAVEQRLITMQKRRTQAWA